ncbi:Omega-hydroxypalmitate O-feruloyl transferase [Apostasia shenzhenica]|uniref:Omega-hydroxypalmitate O-feruloyl transferase n=1 Tax=Apostasia shenzhenica TaxID=1088818 RepID=A0A2I0ANS0_9ASPA|nr:Omega-hydroxypalmitate O-feruloyl transferase [Apostasia shenzhenica]
METVFLNEQNVKRGKILSLVSPRNHTSRDAVFLSNIDQTVAFNVETVFFYEGPECDGSQAPGSDIIERVKKAVAEELLIPYFFMAGRLRFNLQKSRLELVCNNEGVLFVGATSSLRLSDLGDLSCPNPSFQQLVLQIKRFQILVDTPLFSIQVTKFKCGGFSIGFVTNHSILDGRSAAAMFTALASACRGEGMKTNEVVIIDRSCMMARDPPQITFNHPEYMICSSFEAVVAHLWRARTGAVFSDPTKVSSVLFAVDIRSKMSPQLPSGFSGNAVITASASARVEDFVERSWQLSYFVRLVKEAIERVSDEYVRSVIDWLEVNKGVPCAMNGNFFVSAWWKLPFNEIDFGWGRPVWGGPVAGGMEEFVLLLSDGNGMGKESGINVWIALEPEKMLKFESLIRL